MPQAAIISDASPLHYLVLLDVAELLPRLFEEVIVPPAVAWELSQASTPVLVRRWIAQSRGWLRVVSPTKSSFMQDLDAGESEAISLALELEHKIILIDERKGRRVARDLGLEPLGTLAVLEVAACCGWIDYDECIRDLRATNFRISDRLLVESAVRVRSTRL